VRIAFGKLAGLWRSGSPAITVIEVSKKPRAVQSRLAALELLLSCYGRDHAPKRRRLTMDWHDRITVDPKVLVG
jgi:hypothetical protein